MWRNLYRIRFSGNQRFLQLGDVKFSVCVENVFGDRDLPVGTDFPDDDRILVQVHVGEVQGDVFSGRGAVHDEQDLAPDREVPGDDEGNQLDLVFFGN